MKKILVTGASGFIGYHITKKLLEEKYEVLGLDNINNYYETELKKHRLNLLQKNTNFSFCLSDISNKENLEKVFRSSKIEYVIHLAAQAGVRYSIENPDVYIKSNIIGTFNILEMCRKYPIKHLIYASSSSVYGANKKVPFEETDSVDYPVSLYAATKKSNELMAYSYSHLYHIPTTGIRFFTVYGPLGRPDMAYYKFTKNYFDGKHISIFNNGNSENDLSRDFTYIDDAVDGIIKLLFLPPNEKNNYHQIFNIGNNKPEKLMIFITTLEKCLSRSIGSNVKFKKKYVSIKKGDVEKTYASTDHLEKKINFKPKTSIKEGLQKFTDWYVDYYKLKK